VKRLCVFCGSSIGGRPAYAAAARVLADELCRRRLGVVYGGGGIGLMGVLADAMLAQGGEVIGVIPRPLATKELAHPGLTHMHVVESMHWGRWRTASSRCPAGWGPSRRRSRC
jgi:uncharacterized protein (TIGR00730 family)